MFQRLFPIVAAGALALAVYSIATASASTAQQSKKPKAAQFAITPTENAQLASQPSGAAAVIDGHVIPMSQVIAICLRDDGPFVVDQLVQNYVVDRECARRGITVSPAEIDQQVENLRRSIAPTTLDEALKMHHTTLATLRYQFKQDMERERLVFDQVKPTKMVHCHVILVRSSPPGAPVSVTGTTRTDAEALSLITDVQRQLAAGKDFGALATKYTELSSESAGDIGILYSGIHDVDTALLNAALALNNGEVTKEPVKILNGYCLIQAISTSDSHSSSEDSAYTAALKTYKQQQAQFLESPFIVDLIAKSKVVYYVHN